MEQKQKNGFTKFLALLIVFTLICPGVLSAKKEKHGAWLKVTKLDGQLVEGELLNVKDSEILLKSNSESGITIPVNEIKMIQYKKKGKFLTGAAIGLGISMIATGIFYKGMESESPKAVEKLLWGVIIGIPGGLIFGAASSLFVSHKTCNFQNASPENISINLKKLKALARF
jgi:hypothetical protein